MIHIVANINSLEQYLSFIEKEGHKALLPTKCLYCGKASPWCHGFYTRKADRENSAERSLNPLRIFRSFCHFCKRSCSSLPECIAPRRWYVWAIQQIALLLTIAGHSRRAIAGRLSLGRSTLLRWETRFKSLFKTHTFHLCSREPELGRNGASFTLFWGACLKQMSLSRAMYWINHAGEIIP